MWIEENLGEGWLQLFTPLMFNNTTVYSLRKLICKLKNILEVPPLYQSNKMLRRHKSSLHVNKCNYHFLRFILKSI